MAKKEKVNIIRPDEFGEVEEALNEALNSLDAANTRVSSLLESERRGEDPPELFGSNEEEGSAAEVSTTDTVAPKAGVSSPTPEDDADGDADDGEEDTFDEEEDEFDDDEDDDDDDDEDED